MPTYVRPTGAPAPFADQGLLIPVGVALLLANGRYWLTIAPRVHKQLARWERAARAIPDPELQKLAVDKLRNEGFNAEVAAALATTAPRLFRKRTVDAIVALEILFDYLDGLTERPATNAHDDGRSLFSVFLYAVGLLSTCMQSQGPNSSARRDRDYMRQLATTVRLVLQELPAFAAVDEALAQSAVRCREAQVRHHAASWDGVNELQAWAAAEAADTGLAWQEYLAGAASSVLAMHALIAAAADRRTTRAQGRAIDDLYLLISVMPTTLDSLVDYEHDQQLGQPGFIRYYDNQYVLARRLGRIIDDIVHRARQMPHGPHHIMMLAGVVSYYGSNPGARSQFAKPVFEVLHHKLRPLTVSSLAILRAWRQAKALNLWFHASRQRTLGAMPKAIGH